MVAPSVMAVRDIDFLIAGSTVIRMMQHRIDSVDNGAGAGNAVSGTHKIKLL